MGRMRKKASQLKKEVVWGKTEGSILLYVSTVCKTEVRVMAWHYNASDSPRDGGVDCIFIFLQALGTSTN